jgi:hypothetical protein
MKEERAAQLAGKKTDKSSSTTGASANANDAPEKVGLLQRSSEDADESLDAAERGEATRGSHEGTSPEVPAPPADQSSRAISPDSTDLGVGARSPGMSEKARGKMRERSVSLEALDPDLERIAAQGVGRNGFIPTQEWVGCLHFVSPDCAHDPAVLSPTGCVVAARVRLTGDKPGNQF